MKIDDKYKWLARDKNGKLWAYEEKPEKEKNNGHWSSIGFSNHVYIEELTDVYSEISWEDKEPRLIYRISKEDYDLIENLDNINKPSHYHSNGTDVIGFAEAQFSKEEQKGFHRINAIKYITRYDRKNGIEDLEKAKFYIDKLIELEEHESIPEKPTNDPLQDFLIALRNTKVVTDNSDAKIATFYHGYNPLD